MKKLVFLFCCLLFAPKPQISRYIVVPDTIAVLFNGVTLGTNDRVNIIKTKGGRWVTSSNIRTYYPGVIDSIKNIFGIDTVVEFDLPIDSFPAPVYTYSTGN